MWYKNLKTGLVWDVDGRNKDLLKRLDNQPKEYTKLSEAPKPPKSK